MIDGQWTVCGTFLLKASINLPPGSLATEKALAEAELVRMLPAPQMTVPKFEADLVALDKRQVAFDTRVNSIVEGTAGFSPALASIFTEATLAQARRDVTKACREAETEKASRTTSQTRMDVLDAWDVGVAKALRTHAIAEAVHALGVRRCKHMLHYYTASTSLTDIASKHGSRISACALCGYTRGRRLFRYAELSRCGCCERLYCSSDCQRKDWPVHKKFCGDAGECGVDFDMCVCAKHRFIVYARRDIASGETIMAGTIEGTLPFYAARGVDEGGNFNSVWLRASTNCMCLRATQKIERGDKIVCICHIV